MDWIDISVPIQPSLQVWNDESPFRIERIASIAGGDVANVSTLELGAHTGTHIDAPIHFIDGAPAAESIPLDALIGPALVVEVQGTGGRIRAAEIESRGIPPGETRVLLKSPNAALWDRPGFSRDFLGLDQAAARALVDHGVRLVGIEYLSMAPFDEPIPTHQVLLGAGVVVVEGLDLRKVEPGPYELVCLPLRIVGSDGAPARALVRPRTGTTTEAGPREAM